MSRAPALTAVVDFSNPCRPFVVPLLAGGHKFHARPIWHRKSSFTHLFHSISSKYVGSMAPVFWEEVDETVPLLAVNR